MRSCCMHLNEFLLPVRALAQRFDLGRQLLHGLREFGQLSGDARYVLRGCDSTAILRVAILGQVPS